MVREAKQGWSRPLQPSVMTGSHGRNQLRLLTRRNIHFSQRTIYLFHFPVRHRCKVVLSLAATSVLVVLKESFRIPNSTRPGSLVAPVLLQFSHLSQLRSQQRTGFEFPRSMSAHCWAGRFLSLERLTFERQGVLTTLFDKEIVHSHEP